MSLIKVENLNKSFGKLKVLKDVSMTVEKSDVIAIIGSSGSGKSTLLRSLIHLETINSGSIAINNKYLVKNGVYAHKQEIKDITSEMGMVFQNFNLFPHMSVIKNLELAPLLQKKLTKDEIHAKAERLLARVGLSSKLDEYPDNLSGGQKQRVAIARALMIDPEIMLFDEPTSALDPELTNEVLSTIKELASDNMTMVIVTHEMGFARDVAKTIMFMDDGNFIEQGSPEQIFNNPQQDRTRAFINSIL